MTRELAPLQQQGRQGAPEPSNPSRVGRRRAPLEPACPWRRPPPEAWPPSFEGLAPSWVNMRRPLPPYAVVVPTMVGRVASEALASSFFLFTTGFSLATRRRIS